MWGLCEDFDINTSPCSGGNRGEKKLHSPHPWGKCGDFVFTVFHETLETEDENVFRLANRRWRIEYEAARRCFYLVISPALLKYRLIHSSYYCLLPTLGYVARCSFHWVH